MGWAGNPEKEGLHLSIERPHHHECADQPDTREYSARRIGNRNYSQRRDHESIAEQPDLVRTSSRYELCKAWTQSRRFPAR